MTLFENETNQTSKLDFKKMGHSRPLFHLFSPFRTVQLLKNLAASGIRTRIVGAVGENADHYTTTTAQVKRHYCFEHFSGRTQNEWVNGK